MRCIIELQFDLCKLECEGTFEQQLENMQEAFFCLKKIKDLLELSSFYELVESKDLMRMYKDRCRYALRKLKLK